MPKESTIAISTAAALLEMEGADICFRSNPNIVRIKSVDWSVAPGEYWVVGGPMESGKTELLCTAAGLHFPARGHVRLFGQELSELHEPDLLKSRARIGFVIRTGGRIFADMTVAENIALPLRYHHNLPAHKTLDTVHELLHLTELGDIGSQMPQSLGQSLQIRLDLARALALKPEILFLDEPLVGLGWRHRQWWLDFLQKLTEGIPFMNGKKVTVVAVTNEYAPWKGRPVRYALIRDSQLQILGPSAEPPSI